MLKADGTLVVLDFFIELYFPSVVKSLGLKLLWNEESRAKIVLHQ